MFRNIDSCYGSGNRCTDAVVGKGVSSACNSGIGLINAGTSRSYLCSSPAAMGLNTVSPMR